MDYRTLGRSGLKVSAYGLGVMTFGGQTPEEDAMRQMDMALDAGITLFDTAENYPTPTGPETQGRSEELLGKWARSRGVRDRVVIATKVAGPGNVAGDMTHIRGEQRCLDRANIRQAVEDSLRRLGSDHIDLYQLHWPERPVTTLGRSRFSLLPDNPALTPMEETLAALSELVTEGKLRAIGVCNESAWGVMHYLALAESGKGPRIASIQNNYSLIDRYFELGLAEIAIREGIGLLGYSPLARGLLTAKHLDLPEGEIPRHFTPNKRRAVGEYAALAGQAGLDPVHMALAFAQQQPFMASVLMAASTQQQLEMNLGALNLALPKELVKAINAIHDNNPNPR